MCGVEAPICHGHLQGSPVMLKDTKLLFQIVSLLDAFSFLNFLPLKFTKPPPDLFYNNDNIQSVFMTVTVYWKKLIAVMHCTDKAELQSYLQSLDNRYKYR